MKPGIGTDIPGEDIDEDRDGVPDPSERDFANDGKATRREPGTAGTTKPGTRPPADDDDGGLESIRPPHGDVVPPASN